MKYSVTIPVAVLFFATLFSCQKTNEIVVPKAESDIHTLRVAFPSLSKPDGTKVSLATSGKTQWEVGDKMVIFGRPSSSETSRVVHEIVGDDITNPEEAEFEVDLSGLEAETDSRYHAYNVAFPYTDGQQYYYSKGDNYGRIRFQETNQLLMSGYVNDGLNSIVLNHLTAAITFSVSGDYDSYVFSGGGESEVVGYSNFIVEVRKNGSEGKYRQKYKDGGTSGPLTEITGSVNGNGTAVNYVFLPVNAERSGSSPEYTYDTESTRYANVVYLPNGFTIKLIKGGVIKKYITSTAPLTISPGHMINLGELPAAYLHDYVNPKRENTIGVDVSNATDLSASATSNCYIVDGSDLDNAGKSFKFKAARGKGGIVLNTIGGDDDKDVVILWSTKNVAAAPSANEIISAVDYDIDQDGEDAYIVFKMPNPIVPGNAIIAAKNANGEILWSWHIWVPKDAISYITYGNKTSSKLMMSRNLGALVDTPADGSAVDVTSLGLLYQWGRKDPFVGVQSLGSKSFAGVSGTAKTNNGGKMSIAQTVAYPTVFGNTSDDLRDWNSTPDNLLWGANGSTKTQYDPCPVGYRVPTRDLLSAFISAVTWTSSMANYYVKADDITGYGFPITNHMYSKYGNMYEYDEAPLTYLWTSYRNSDSDGSAYVLRIKKNGEVSLSSASKANAASVRCVAE